MPLVEFLLELDLSIFLRDANTQQRCEGKVQITRMALDLGMLAVKLRIQNQSVAVMQPLVCAWRMAASCSHWM